ncbi:M16 family metallopeptidase [Haloferula sargassicola]|uniref:Zinc protease Rv2782c n=1 Tax=Haloferula sargassicola TaxID=490096 RepID=A0ABP9UII6_9BACT
MRATYHECRSRTGVRLAVARLPDSECAAMSIHVPAGSRDDPPGLAGTAHFVEHMLFKGTARRDARGISIETEDAGAMLNAHTSEDQTAYEGRGDADTLPLLADILCDMVWHSRFAAEDIELEREVIAEEIVMYEESPGDHIGDLLSAALWSPHPLGEPISGSLESLRRIDRETLVGFATGQHRRDDLVVAVAGPYEPQAVIDLLDPLLPDLQPALSSVPFKGLAKGESLRIDERDTQQVQLAIAYPTFGRRDPRRHALRLLAMILGEGSSSRLFLQLREDRGLCYHVSCDATLLEETGALEFVAGLDPEGLEESVEILGRELSDLATRGPNAAELARAKRLAFSQHRAAMESTASHASWAADSLLHHGKIICPKDALARIDEVSAAAVREVAAGLLASGTRARAEIRPS